MGSCLSSPEEPAKKKTTTSGGGGQRLGSGPSAGATPAATAPTAAAGGGRGGQAFVGGGKTVGDGYEDPARLDGDAGAKAAAARAAEQRAQAAAARGVSSTNPKAGQLSAKLAEHNREVDGRRAPAGDEGALAKASDWN